MNLLSTTGQPRKDYPVLLFPLRLETRFLNDQANQTTDLWVRIYPDQMSIDTHEPRLSRLEFVAGQRYQEYVSQADASEEDRRSAWRELARLVGPERAAWIVRTIEGLGDTGQLQLRAAHKAWLQNSRLIGLPDRFVHFGTGVTEREKEIKCTPVE